MNNQRVYFVLFLCLFLISFANAGIFIDDSNLTDYNVGDAISFSFVVEEQLPVSKPVDVYFICDDEDELVFKEFRNFAKDATQDFVFDFIADREGNCSFKIVFDDEVVSTNAFTISSDLTFDLTLQGKVFDPGERVFLKGEVSKIHNNNFSYDVHIEVGDFFTKDLHVNHSYFNVSFLLPASLAYGIYDVRVTVREFDLFDSVLNDAVFEDEIEILPKPTAIVIETEESFEPAYSLPVTAKLVDQSGMIITNESLFLKVFDITSQLYFDTIVSSGETVTINFSSNAVKGGWKITSFYGSISATKLVSVLPNAEVFVSFENGTSHVVISNVGNVPYEGIVLVKANNSLGVVEIPLNVVNLSVGDSQQNDLNLSGSYNLTVNGKEYRDVMVTSPITGAAILDGVRLSYVAIFLSIFLIVILIFGFLFIRHKVKQTHKEDSFSTVMPTKQGNVSFKKVTLSEKKDFASDLSLHEPQKKLYALFFDLKESDDIGSLRDFLDRYGLKYYQMGDMHFTLLKSGKSPENKLIHLCSMVIGKTAVRNVFFHSVSLEKSSSIYSYFSGIRALLSMDKGLVVSEDILKRLSTKNDFKELGERQFKETLIKLFYLSSNE